MEGLNKVWEGASQEIYAAQASAEAAGGAPGQEAPAAEGQPDQDVSDVEYEEVDDKK
jgi:molecular chaperone DnaK